ncbi:MAG: AMP-binding protein [Pseudomonadota bacterium]
MRDPNIAYLLRRNAVLYAQREALHYNGESVTHAALLQRAARAGNALAGLGVRPGDRVAVIARNTLGMLDLLCACELFGYVAVPLNHRLADRELAGIIADSEPAVLVADLVFTANARFLRGGADKPLLLLLLGQGTGDAAGEKDFTRVMAAASDTPPATDPSPDDTAYIIYTSGSTGKPKGVMLCHRGMVEGGRLLADSAGVRTDSTQIVVMPLFHVGGAVQRMAYVARGGRLVLHDRFDAERLAREIDAGGVTDLHIAPTMLRSLLDVMDRQPINVSSLESLKYASSPIPEDTLGRAMRAFGPVLQQYYGLTEAGAIATVLPKYVHAEALAGIGAERLRTAGQTHLGVDVRIRRGDGSECAVGEAGEVCLRSQSVMTGYWRNPQMTAETIEDGWLRTGDVGFVDAEQYITIIDRLKDMIVSGGENIYSSEVERALETHPAVLETAVIGIPDDQWGEAVHACVVLRPGAALTGEELIVYCKTRIASYKKPRSVEIMDALPRLLHVQKIDKPTLRRRFWGDKQRGVN